MDTINEINERLSREAGYYKSQLDGLTGVVVSLEYKLAEMSNEVSQMRKGLRLIADMQEFRPVIDLKEIYDHFTEQINLRLQMDHCLALMPVGGSRNYLSPAYAKGYSSAALHSL